jgi:hypothetical protein
MDKFLEALLMLNNLAKGYDRWQALYKRINFRVVKRGIIISLCLAFFAGKTKIVDHVQLSEPMQLNSKSNFNMIAFLLI